MNLRITGLEQVQRALRDLPAHIVVKGYAKALDRAAGVIAAEVEARAPRGPEDSLADSVRVQVEVDAQRRGGRASVGFAGVDERTGLPQDQVAMLVETGHRQVTHRPGHREVGHVPAHPFVRPAFDSAGDRAIEVFNETLIDSLAEVGP